MISWPNWRSRMPPRAMSGMLGDQAEDVARGRLGVPAEEKVGAAEMEEAEGMRLEDLPQIHQPAQLDRGRRDLHREQHIARLRRRQQMADGADAADAGAEPGHLPEGPALAESLEAAKLGDVEARSATCIVFIEKDGDLRVAFDPRHRVDDDALGHDRSVATLNAEVQPLRIGIVPSSRGVRRPFQQCASSTAADAVCAGGGQPGRK